jgi:hypothetical protein
MAHHNETGWILKRKSAGAMFSIAPGANLHAPDSTHPSDSNLEPDLFRNDRFSRRS